jgi:hypothetical protein
MSSPATVPARNESRSDSTARTRCNNSSTSRGTTPGFVMLLKGRSSGSDGGDSSSSSGGTSSTGGGTSSTGGGTSSTGGGTSSCSTTPGFAKLFKGSGSSNDGGGSSGTTTAAAAAADGMSCKPGTGKQQKGWRITSDPQAGLAGGVPVVGSDMEVVGWKGVLLGFSVPGQEAAYRQWKARQLCQHDLWVMPLFVSALALTLLEAARLRYSSRSTLGLGSGSLVGGSDSLDLGVGSLGGGSWSLCLGSESSGLGSESSGLGSGSLGLGSESLGLGFASPVLGCDVLGLGSGSQDLGSGSQDLGSGEAERQAALTLGVGFEIT